MQGGLFFPPFISMPCHSPSIPDPPTPAVRYLHEANSTMMFLYHCLFQRNTCLRGTFVREIKSHNATGCCVMRWLIYIKRDCLLLFRTCLAWMHGDILLQLYFLSTVWRLQCKQHLTLTCSVHVSYNDSAISKVMTRTKTSPFRIRL